MVRRRSAVEPPIGHMKSDDKLRRNWLKGALGDALNAGFCGAGHNIRLIINKLRAALRNSSLIEDWDSSGRTSTTLPSKGVGFQVMVFWRDFHEFRNSNRN